MTYPHYKNLNNDEREKFKAAWQQKINASPFYPRLYNNIQLSTKGFKLYFLIAFIVVLFNSAFHLSFLFTTLLGFLSAQLMFALFHMRIHALFLEYDQWNADSINRVMQTPIVSFYAFYHHHHNLKDNWLPQLSYYETPENPDGTNYILLAHWYSFSFFNVAIKIPMVIYMLLIAFYLNPYLSFAAFLGYELGQFFIPVFHGYGHEVEHQILTTQEINPTLWQKLTINFNQNMFFIMRKLRLVATPEQHAVHHKNYRTTDYVYRSFSSSGIYFAAIDKLLDKLYLWGFKNPKIKAYDKLRIPTLILATTFFLLPYFMVGRTIFP